MANLLITKKLYKTIVVKEIKEFSTIKNIVENHNNEGRPFFIFILKESSNRHERQSERLYESNIGQPISAILLTNLPCKGDKLDITHFKPNAFKNVDCENFVKKYKHPQFQAKKNINSLFYFANRHHGKDSNSIYPCDINEF